MLTIDNIDVYYGEVIILKKLSMEVEEGELVSLVGANGSGKSTLLKTISGLLTPEEGEILFKGERINEYPPDKIVNSGISQVPEGRHIFEKLSVKDNLLLGAHTVGKGEEDIEETLNWVYDLFPILEERETQKAGTFSGGQQQMLAIARALMSRPDLLMLDEPSLGLMPTFVNKVFDTLAHIHSEGTTVLLVEQNVKRALESSDTGYVLQNGEIINKGDAEELLQTDMVREAYLGL